jgi:hypothetical protein
MTYPTGYQPQAVRSHLHQVPGQGVVIQVANKQPDPVMVAVVPKVIVAANPVIVDQQGRQLPGNRELGKPPVVVMEYTLPATAKAPVVGTIGTSARTGQTVFRPEQRK